EICPASLGPSERDSWKRFDGIDVDEIPAGGGVFLVQYVDGDAVGTGRETGKGALRLPPIGRIVQIQNGLAVAINYDFGPAAIHRSSVGVAKAPPFKIEPDRSA